MRTVPTMSESLVQRRGKPLMNGTKVAARLVVKDEQNRFYSKQRIDSTTELMARSKTK